MGAGAIWGMGAGAFWESAIPDVRRPAAPSLGCAFL